MSDRPVVIVELPEGVCGWCSSCDRVTEICRIDTNKRECCVVCGDYLICDPGEEEEEPA